MRNSRREVAYIAAAFLVLSAISLYRQIIMRNAPDDLIRPVAVYLVYLVLLAVWWVSVRNRVTQRNMRIFLLAEHAVMFAGITIRFIQDASLHHFMQNALSSQDLMLMRYSGYASIVPLMLFPLFGLFASLGLGKTEEHRINRNWFYLMIPTGILVLLMLTNESHHLMILPTESGAQDSLYYRPNIGTYVYIAWAACLFVARILHIFHKTREIDGHPALRSAPVLIAIVMLLVNIPYLISSYVVDVELIEYTVLLYFLEAIIWESCILVGMVPVNTHYDEVFDRSTIAMQILNHDGGIYVKSSEAPAIPPSLFESLKNQSGIRTPEGLDVRMHSISGGYAIWQNDVSQTIAVIDELQQTAEKLEQEGDLLRRELAARSDAQAVKEQNRIYNQLTDEIGEQLLLLRNLLDKREKAKDKALLFKKICLIGAYVKRRCNLRLIEQSDGSISNTDLDLCFAELIGCLEQLGIESAVLWNTEQTLTPDFAIFAFDAFELLLEHEQFELRSITAAFEADMTFMLQLQFGSGFERQLPENELQRINKGDYEIRMEPYKEGYQVSVRG